MLLRCEAVECAVSEREVMRGAVRRARAVLLRRRVDGKGWMMGMGRGICVWYLWVWYVWYVCNICVMCIVCEYE